MAIEAVDLKARRAGVLLHITSLPSPFAQGVLGVEALQFIDAIQAAGYTVWQFLPLGPTHDHGSPYESLSSSAGNEKLIDLRECVASGWLDEADLAAYLTGELSKEDALTKASTQFWQETEANGALKAEITAFQAENAAWLDDYALFVTIKYYQQGKPWWLWPAVLRDRDASGLNVLRELQNHAMKKVIFSQFMFVQQWQKIQKHAQEKGVLLFGDLPIYVAHDSVDVWANRDFFTVDDEGYCEEVAGVPPDYFSATGQRWGNPLYKWDKLEQDGFAWWVQRVRTQMQRMDMLRIDHFRGLEAFWVIPAEHDNGMVGEWRKAAGDALLQTLKHELGALPIVAEDLGLITQEVHALRKKFTLPGMKILHFAFGGDADNPYLPHQHEPDMVVYTGTHDNDTTLGWWDSLDEAGKAHVRNYLGVSGDEIHWSLIRSALASVSALAMIPMQDLLGLKEARFNTPGTLADNWSWRMQHLPDQDAPCWQLSRLWNQLYRRG